MATTQAVLDLIPLPRLTFSWPGLELVNCTPTAEPFLPQARNIRLFNPRQREPKLAIDFGLIFAQSDDHPTHTTKQWVDALLADSAAAFEHPVRLKPRHFRHPTAATLFLAPAPAPASPAPPGSSEAPAQVLQVMLLSAEAEKGSPGSPARVGGPTEFVSAPLPEVEGKDMSLDETDALLLQFTKGTLDKSNGVRVLTDEEVRLVVEDLPEIAFTANNCGEVTWFSKRWYEFTGLSHVDDMSFDTWRNTFHPEDLPYVFGVWQHALAHGTRFTFTYRIRGKDGHLRWFVCKGKPCWDEHGQIKQWVATLVDVEELVNARQEAVKMKDHIKAILSSSQTIVLSVSTDMTVTFFEGSPHEASALSPAADGSPLGLPLLQVWPDADLRDAIQTMLNDGAESTTLKTSIDRDGAKSWYRYKLTPLMGDRQRDEDAGKVVGVSAIGANITEMVEAEEELKRATAERAHLIASEMAALEASRLKTEYFTHISHETRTPVAGIISIAELLLADPTLGEEHRTLVGQVLRSGEVLLELVGMVLDMRKVESGELKLERAPFTLADVLEDAALLTVIAKKKKLDFIQDIGPVYGGALLGDRMRLRQVLANGLSNAAKFTDKGSVTLKVRQAAETASSVTMQFTVIDTGCGISAAVLPTLFQPFRQADSSTARRYGGTGLGLVITKELLALMGGRVELESEEGRGTRMTISVVLEKNVEAEVGKGSRRGTPELRRATSGGSSRVVVEAGRDAAVEGVKRRRRPGTVRILVAEDNELLKSLTVKLLEKMQFEVGAVDDGAQAVEEVHRRRYDIVLMDGQMPVKDGYTATREIRADPDPQIANVRIIALTASAFQGDRERCLQAGMSHYISKPVRAKDLEQAIWEQLAEEERAQRRSPSLP